MRRALLATAVLLVGVGACHAQEKETSLRGTWAVELMERGGRQPPAELLEKCRIIIRGNKIELRTIGSAESESGTFQVDSKKSRREIEVTFMEGKDKDVKRVAKGIYDLRGDSLKLSWCKDGGARPTEFASTPGDRASELFVLKRVDEE